MIGPGGPVIPHLFALPVSVLWVGLKKEYITKHGCEKYIHMVTYWAPVKYWAKATLDYLYQFPFLLLCHYISTNSLSYYCVTISHVIPPLDFCPLRPPKGLEWTSSHQCTSSGWGHSSCFGDEPKTHPLPLPRDFSAPFSAPKFSPPTYLPHLISHSLHLQCSEELLSLSSTELREDMRHKAWGRWRGEAKRTTSS